MDKRLGPSRRKPRAAKCVREKLTDRIVAWMIDSERNGSSQHFARDVAKAMGCSVGSAAQGLYYLFCIGCVELMRTRNSAKVYWLTPKGRVKP